MGPHIEQIETSTAPESLLRELAGHFDALDAEDLPNDPPIPVEMRIAEWRNVSVHYPELLWLLRDHDGIAATAVAAYSAEQNLDNGYGRVQVTPEKRGRGYGRAISGPMLEHLDGSGRRRFDTVITKGAPSEGVARRLGLEFVYEERRSRLWIADLDMSLMQWWIDRAAERASDYEVAYHLSPLPDDLVDKFCDLTYIMNTAPREDFQEEDETLTPAAWREFESNLIAADCQMHNVIAFHVPSGEMVGYTQIKTQGPQPDLAWNWDTAVDPGHRNRGLGRWLKAAMIQRVVAGHPELRRVDTYNAGSNAPMLEINVEMGYRPILVDRSWQGDLATVRERLGV